MQIFGWAWDFDTYAQNATMLFSVDRDRARAGRNPPEKRGEAGNGRRRLLSAYKWLLPEITDSGLMQLRKTAVLRSMEIAYSFLSISPDGSVEQGIRGIRINPKNDDIHRHKTRGAGNGTAAVTSTPAIRLPRFASYIVFSLI